MASARSYGQFVPWPSVRPPSSPPGAFLQELYRGAGPMRQAVGSAHIYIRFSITALSSSQLSPETVQDITFPLRWRPPSALHFPSSRFHRLCSARQTSFFSRAPSCLRTVSHRASDRQWPDLEARAHPLHPLLHYCHRPCWRPQAKIRRQDAQGSKV